LKVGVISRALEVNAMGEFFIRCITLSSVVYVVLSGFAVSAKGSEAGPGLKVTVRVYNYAHISPRTQAEATREATKIFSEVGVETLWLDCRLSMADFHGDMACQEPFRPTDLVLRILPQCKTKAYRDVTFGVSLPSVEEDERGFIANIFWDRIEELTKWHHLGQFQILGLVAAHEIGHLLLGLNSHSSMGIMRANWNQKDLERASQGLLHFTPQQSERIRTEVGARKRELERSVSERVD
jgi:hypothetical protein